MLRHTQLVISASVVGQIVSCMVLHAYVWGLKGDLELYGGNELVMEEQTKEKRVRMLSFVLLYQNT